MGEGWERPFPVCAGTVRYHHHHITIRNANERGGLWAKTLFSNIFFKNTIQSQGGLSFLPFSYSV